MVIKDISNLNKYSYSKKGILGPSPTLVVSLPYKKEYIFQKPREEIRKMFCQWERNWSMNQGHKFIYIKIQMCNKLYELLSYNC